MATRSSTSWVNKFEKQHKPRDGRTLVVGSFIADGKTDRRKLYLDAVGVDMRSGPGVDRVLNLEGTLPKDLGKFDHIECLSVLEHSRQPWLLAANLQRLLVKGGTLYLSVPFVWRFHDYGGDYFRFTMDGVRLLFQEIDWTSLAYASDRLRPDPFLKGVEILKHPFLPRCEVLGFGVRK
jgi:SAM-dependent methyltransferase